MPTNFKMSPLYYYVSFHRNSDSLSLNNLLPRRFATIIKKSANVTYIEQYPISSNVPGAVVLTNAQIKR